MDGNVHISLSLASSVFCYGLGPNQVNQSLIATWKRELETGKLETCSLETMELVVVGGPGEIIMTRRALA